MINKSHRKIIIAFIAFIVIGTGLYWRQPIAKATMKIFYGLSVQNGLVGYWNFDECDTCTTAADKSGSGNTGTMYKEAGPTVGDLHTSSGKIGNGISLDGSNDYVGVSASASLSLGTTMTISMWFNQRVATGLQALASSNKYYGAGFNGNWLLRIDSGASIDFASYNGQADAEFQLSPFTINNNVWNHVVVSINGVTATTYFNGVASASGPFTHTKALIDAGVSGMSIGDDLNWANEPFNGLIDDVRIYNRALSAGEVRYLAEQKGDATIRSSNKNGLVGYWNFDECDTCTTAADKSGNGNTGTMYDNVTAANLHTTSGKIGNGITLDGTNDFVGIPDSAALSPTSALTFGAWVRQSSSAVNKGIVAKWNHGTQETFAFQTNNDDSTSLRVFISASLDDAGVNNASTPSNSWTMGVFHHVAFVYDGAGAANADRLKVYIDGAQQTLTFTGTIPSVLQDSTADVRIGDLQTLNRFWNGLIDDVRIYNRALSADEVKRLYEEGSYRTTINANQNSSFNSGLVGMWSFNGPDVDWASTTAEILDRSGNGNNGDAVNITNKSVRTGMVGQALSFNGSDDYVNAGSGSSLNITSVMTVSSWIKLNSDYTSTQGIAGTSNSAGNSCAYQLEFGRTDNRFTWLQDCNSVNATSNNAITDNKWHHIAAVRSGSTGAWAITFYIDGVLDSTTSTAVNPGTFTSLSIGRTGAYNGIYFNGSIDDVRIYNRALNASEIQELYLSSARQ